jgi:hypothetical protein
VLHRCTNIQLTQLVAEPDIAPDNAIIEAGIMILSTQNLNYKPFPQLLSMSAMSAKKLSADEKNLRKQAKDAEMLERKKTQMQRDTQRVTEFLKTNPWPLQGPDPGQELRGIVWTGGTYYPAMRSFPTFRKKGGVYPLREILFEGHPILVQNFTFNVFVVAFMLEYRAGWDRISQQMLQKAFAMYINAAYFHVLPLVPGLQHTEKSKDALTLESAKKEVAVLLSKILSSRLPQMSPAEAPHQQATKDNPSPHINPSVPKGPRAGEPIQVPINAERPRVQSPDIPDRVASSEDSALNQTERNLQSKYFPSSEGVVKRCIACTSFGHRTWECSALACDLCGAYSGHSNAACPHQQRCGKCRELGHGADGCPEKLARAKSEAVPCDLCGSRAHVEAGCHMIWRTYLPKPEEIVMRPLNLIIRCYSCGGDGHFGPECGIYRGASRLGATTWSTANVWRHFSPSGQNLPAPRVVNAAPVLPKKSFSIKGMANNPIAVDSDDGDEDHTFQTNQGFTSFTSGSVRQSNGASSGTRQQSKALDAMDVDFVRENTYSPPPRNTQRPLPSKKMNGLQAQNGRGRGGARGGARGGRGMGSAKSGDSGSEPSRKRIRKPKKPKANKQPKQFTQAR